MKALLCTLLVIAGASACRDAAAPKSVVDPGNTTGVIRVWVATTGVDLPASLSLSVDDGPKRSIGVNDSLTVTDVPKGNHTVILDGLGQDCTEPGTNRHETSVASRDTTRTSFIVTCWGLGLGTTRLAFVRNGDIYTARLNGTELVPLTSDERNGRPSWSPDGRRLVFSSWRDLPTNHGYADIYVMNADGSNPVRRTTTGTNSDPVWSPDGRSIAFTSWRTDAPFGEVYVVNADDGTKPVRLATGCFPAWSPDGTRIAFSGPDCDDARLDDIYTARADGSNSAALTSASLSQTSYWEPKWSPDGSTIAMTACAAGACNIALINADGSGMRKILGGWGPRWSPNGRIIAFTVFSSSAPAALYGVATDGSYQGLILPNADSPSWRP